MTPQEAKNLKIGIGVVVGIGIIYLLTKNGNDGSGSTNDPTGNGTIVNPGTIQFNAKNIANGLLEAMRYTGTDEEEVQNLLRTVTQQQFGLVVTAFGKPQYNKTLGNQQNPTAWFDELPFVGLKDWLKNELSTTEYATLRLKYPLYL